MRSAHRWVPVKRRDQRRRRLHVAKGCIRPALLNQADGARAVTRSDRQHRGDVMWLRRQQARPPRTGRSIHVCRIECDWTTSESRCDLIGQRSVAALGSRSGTNHNRATRRKSAGPRPSATSRSLTMAFAATSQCDSPPQERSIAILPRTWPVALFAWAAAISVIG